VIIQVDCHQLNATLCGWSNCLWNSGRNPPECYCKTSIVLKADLHVYSVMRIWNNRAHTTLYDS